MFQSDRATPGSNTRFLLEYIDAHPTCTAAEARKALAARNSKEWKRGLYTWYFWGGSLYAEGGAGPGKYWQADSCPGGLPVRRRLYWRLTFKGAEYLTALRDGDAGTETV
jgi:hypothetical protein